MTISRRQPLLYYLLLIILLQWSTIIGDGAVLYNSNNNYDDVFYQDMNYYDTFANPGNDLGTANADQALLQQRPIDDASIGNEQDELIQQQLDSEQAAVPREEDASEQESLAEIDKSEEADVAADEEATHRKREASEDHNVQHQDQEQKAAYTCHAQTPEQQACLDAAVKDTKDTIEHVTSLIKRMREHAVSIVKEINELEGDFLGSCQDERPKPNCPRRPPASNCRAPFGLQQENESGSNNQNGNGNSNNENYLLPAWIQRGDTGNNNNNEGGANTQKVNTNTNAKSSSNSKGAPTKPRVVINEFGIPIKTDTSDLPPNEFIEQAQYAVHAWKNQIEECKRLLDEAMLHAAQHQSTDNSDNAGTSVQHIIKIVKQPEDADSLHADDAAPAAAASITPVRAAKEVGSSSSVNANNNNNNIADDNAALLKARNNLIAALKMNTKNDDKLAVSAEGAKAVHGDNNNDADTDINDSTNSKRNEDSKKCRSGDEEKKHRAIPPLLNILQGMGF